MKKSYFTIPLIFLFGASVYAANTLIANITGNQVADQPNSYPSQQIRTLGNGDLKFINKDNDSILTGDYFSGYYYDSAYGVFQTNTGGLSSGVSISLTSVSGCPANYTGRKLTGYSYNPEFGFMDFDYNSSIYTYICIPDTAGQLGNTLSSYLAGYAYSTLIGFQNFDGIMVQSSVLTQNEGSQTLSSRQIKILGLASSQNVSETAPGQFLQDVKLVGKASKPELRKKIQQNVATAIRGVTTPITSGTISNLSGTSGWQTGVAGTSILAGEGRYFSPSAGGNIAISGTNLSGNKTLVVEGGNISITGNITGNGILALIALEKNGVGGNIYINPSVTDIHAVIYVDRSVISYNGSELDGSTTDETLANQLYIKGSLFSENTLGGFELTKCPFYVTSSNCSTKEQAAKYDLNYLRRYVLVSETDEFGTVSQYPQYNANQSFAGGTTRGSRNTDFEEYAVVIEYDSRVQQSTPSLLQ